MSIGSELDNALKKILADLKLFDEDRKDATNYLNKETMSLDKRLSKLQAEVKKLSKKK